MQRRLNPLVLPLGVVLAASLGCGGNSLDDDGDGFTELTNDCDDTDATIHPTASDTWYDGVDSDCGGGSDYDADADGYAHDSYGGTDCDDTDASIYPGAPESCEDGEDLNCDGSAGSSDEDGDGVAACDDCDDTDPSITATSTYYLDGDGDGYGYDDRCSCGCIRPRLR